MAKKTKKAYQEYLNNIGCSFEDCEYLCNPRRGDYIQSDILRKRLEKNQYGMVLRLFDPIAFMVGFRDWSRN